MKKKRKIVLAYSGGLDTSVIIGATTLEQLKTNIDSVNVNLNKEIIKKIGEIQKRYPNPCP